MQTITPELAAILKSHLQAGPSGHRARVEFDPLLGAGGVQILSATPYRTFSESATPLVQDIVLPVTQDKDLLLLLQASRYGDSYVVPTGWVTNAFGSGSGLNVMSRACNGTEGGTTVRVFSNGDNWQGWVSWLFHIRGGTTYGVEVAGGVGAGLSPSWGSKQAVWIAAGCDTHGGNSGTITYPAAYTLNRGNYYTGGFNDVGMAVAAKVEATATTPAYSFTTTENPPFDFGMTVAVADIADIPPILAAPSSVSLDKSLNLQSDQGQVTFPNEGLALGFGATSELVTNQRMRIYQWYGDNANEVLTFTGLIDAVNGHRDVLTASITCLDMFLLLTDQTFSTIGPQGATEAGTVRTKANGVYLSMEVSAIVTDILDRAGWPSADRDIMPTSYVLDEYIIADGASWSESIIGKEKLTGLVGYSAWADEAGVFHFGPTTLSQNLTEPVTPVYTFRTGEDILVLDSHVDQDNLRTRVKVRGPLTTQTLQDTWREVWRTDKIKYPVGLWYAPSEPTILRVIDRSTKRLYRIRQSDRAVLGSSYLGGVIPYPLGLSGDPADATVYWVLNAPWKFTGSTSGNSVKKVRKSDNHVLATYAIPNGRWSAIKVSTSNLWLTNLDTDRFYKRSKTDGSAVADYSHTYNSVVQANPSGMMVDGSTLYLFWSNGGTTARFLKCDVSAPGTITGVVKTAGTNLHGGEMDTTTHTECYGDSDDMHLTAKFTLLEAVSQTNQVFAEVVDIALEDELGALAQSEARVHDAHPGDPAHPFVVRRMTLDLRAITNLAQATQTAQRQLDLASQRKRVLDVGILGNPALQKADVVAIVDPVTGISEMYAIDTYRSTQDADGTYVGTLALLPVGEIDDTPTDDGDAT